MSTAVVPTVAKALRRWRRRVGAGLAVGGFADGLGAVALAGAAAALVLRGFGVVVAPHAAFLALLAVPVAWAAVRVRRALPSSAVAAAHLDRRLALDGLLATAAETDASAWATRLDRGLEDRRRGLPRVRWGRAAVRAAVPLAALAGVLALPPLAPPSRPEDAAVRAALERFARRLEALAAVKGLREEARREVEARVAELSRRPEAGAPLRWADLDAVADRVEREAEARAAELAAAAGAAHDAARTAASDPAAAKGAVAALLPDAARLELATGLDPADAAATGLAAGGDPAAAQLPDDAAALGRIAEALGATAAQRFEALTALGAVDPADREALERLLEGDPVARALREGTCSTCRGAGLGPDGKPCAGCTGLSGDGGRPGVGSPTRGRADATLSLTGSTSAGDAASRPERLPPGAKAPGPAVRVGSGRAAPDGRAERDGGAGAAGDEGVGAVAWRRKIAPRHRDAVRAFFGDGPAGAGPGPDAPKAADGAPPPDGTRGPGRPGPDGPPPPTGGR